MTKKFGNFPQMVPHLVLWSPFGFAVNSQQKEDHSNLKKKLKHGSTYLKLSENCRKTFL